MANFTHNQFLPNLLNVYDRVMVLKLFVDSNDDDLKNKYNIAVNNHNNKIINTPAYIDAGFDLFAPTDNPGENNIFFYESMTGFPCKLDYKVVCSAKMYTDNGKCYNTGYYMYPRSSISKTLLRLANGTGIIDAGYRGHLTGMFDIKRQVNIDYNNNTVNIVNSNNLNTCVDYVGEKYDRYVQLCAPGLVPILVEYVNNIEELGEETVRGAGGLGSTGR